MSENTTTKTITDYATADTTTKTITDYATAVTACQLNGDALMQCTPSLKNDKSLVLIAVTTSVDTLLWASPTLKEDKDVLLKACSHFGRAIRYTQLLRSDRDVVLAAVTNDGNALQHVPTSCGLKNDLHIVTSAVSTTPLSLQYASEELRNTLSLLILAGAQDAKALKCATDPAVQAEAAKRIEASNNTDKNHYTTSNSVYGAETYSSLDER